MSLDPLQEAVDRALRGVEESMAYERERRQRVAEERHLVAEVEQYLMSHSRSDDGSDDGGSGTTQPDGHPEGDH